MQRAGPSGLPASWHNSAACCAAPCGDPIGRSLIGAVGIAGIHAIMLACLIGRSHSVSSDATKPGGGVAVSGLGKGLGLIELTTCRAVVMSLALGVYGSWGPMGALVGSPAPLPYLVAGGEGDFM